MGNKTNLKRILFPKILPFLINKEIRKFNKPFEIIESFVNNYKKELIKKK